MGTAVKKLETEQKRAEKALRESKELFLKEVGRPYLPKPFTPDELRAIVRRDLK